MPERAAPPEERPDAQPHIRPDVWIGVDGGATEVKAHEVQILGREGPASLGLGPASSSCVYERARGFRPAPLPSQLLDFERGKVARGGIEGAQARLWIEAAARAISGVAQKAGASRVRVGICMPGLKTADGRGIAVIRNGPRIPDFLERLLAHLAAGGIELAAPIERLSSDGEAAAQGEDSDAAGHLREVACAWYLGGGTGLSEAMKVDGAVRSFDALKGFLRKAWQIETPGGRNVEDLLSPRGMNAAWAAHTGQRLPLAAAEFPERRAAGGDARAAGVLHAAADAFALLAVDRLIGLRRGYPGGSGPRIAANTFAARIVVGQRLGAILADPGLQAVFREPIEVALARQIVATGDGALRKHYLDGAQLRSGFVVPSLLRSAPAIGAVALELRSTEAARARTPAPPF